jgi:hypothetical protein
MVAEAFKMRRRIWLADRIVPRGDRGGFIKETLAEQVKQIGRAEAANI